MYWCSGAQDRYPTLRWSFSVFSVKGDVWCRGLVISSHRLWPKEGSSESQTRGDLKRCREGCERIQNQESLGGQG